MVAILLNVVVFNEGVEAEIYMEAECYINLPISRDIVRGKHTQTYYVHTHFYSCPLRILRTNAI